MIDIKIAKFLSNRFSILSIILFICFVLIFMLVFFNEYKGILIKQGASKIFINKNIVVQHSFFKTFKNKINKLFIFVLSFLLVSAVLIMLSLSFSLVYIINLIINHSWNTIFYLPFMASGLSIGMLVICAILLANITKINKEFQIWSQKNKTLKESVFENISSSENEDLFHSLKATIDLNISLISETPNQKNRNWKWRYTYKDWKSKLLKNPKTFEDEFYYFLIFNYENVAINGQIFKVEDYAYIYQNRHLIFNKITNNQ
ncbi:hypothetical protein OF364_02645 [Mycoplasma enhydrae]|uniref:MAG0920 family protein n=1 Tax=Mycoplasma enhydrae TaxID=2499220 RepID=UPI00197B2875|nr:hypothetical protein [Mycoplasma enhydrae]MBN4089198.1 hypothetical protein [Mycoplasma enhydrae]MCV3733862.1 hypothetical protein [Mycoplasma enhydrae]MCV3753706.1 hypothetical protein [Mycoplasma enhydrae]